MLRKTVRTAVAFFAVSVITIPSMAIGVVRYDSSVYRDSIYDSYPGSDDAVNFANLTSPAFIGRFADAVLFQYLIALDGAKNMPFTIPKKVWQESRFKEQWESVVTEQNAFKRNRLMTDLYDELARAKLSSLPENYQNLKAQEFYFAQPIEWSTEFNFEDMSKTVSSSMRPAKVFFSPEGSRSTWCIGSIAVSNSSAALAWKGSHLVGHILTPQQGTLIDNMTEPKGVSGCGLKYQFTDASKAELFEEIITKQNPIFFYFGKIESVNNERTLSFKIDRVELWANKNGELTKTPFSLTVTSSMGVDEHYQKNATKSAYSVAPENSDRISISELAKSGLIHAKRDRFFQFFDDGNELYVREDNNGSATIARYVREKVGQGLVYRLDGLEGAEPDKFPHSLYFSTDENYHVVGEKVYMLERHNGPPISYIDYVSKSQYTGSLRENFLSIRNN
jgi:hypothetical protein